MTRQSTAEARTRRYDVKILIVDDHPLIREALRHVLTLLDDKLELIEARTCAEAMAVVADHTAFDLVLLDLGLPDADGMTALAQMRERYPATPVIVLSATEHASAVTRAIDAGAMGFIPKTSSNQLLLNALRLVLSGGVYLPLEVLRPPRDAAAPVAHHASDANKFDSPRDLGLTARQAEVLALIVQGKPNKLICRELNLAEGTVKIHVTAILKALGVTNRTQAVIAVGRLGWQLNAPGTPSRDAAH
jgi:DNA-binding NarL/FixJ family response regulator